MHLFVDPYGLAGRQTGRQCAASQIHLLKLPHLTLSPGGRGARNEENVSGNEFARARAQEFGAPQPSEEPMIHHRRSASMQAPAQV